MGEIRMWAGNYAPAGWVLCEGQTLNIAQYTTLFSLLGTNYGGNGTTTFNLPDLRGRVPVNMGTGPGLYTIVVGDKSGTNNETLLVPNLPAHNHQIYGTTTVATTNKPTGAILADNSTLDLEYAVASAANTTMAPTATTGNNYPINNMQPYLGVTFIICLNGLYPGR